MSFSKYGALKFKLKLLFPFSCIYLPHIDYLAPPTLLSACIKVNSQFEGACILAIHKVLVCFSRKSQQRISVSRWREACGWLWIAGSYFLFYQTLWWDKYVREAATCSDLILFLWMSSYLESIIQQRQSVLKTCFKALRTVCLIIRVSLRTKEAFLPNWPCCCPKPHKLFWATSHFFFFFLH